MEQVISALGYEAVAHLLVSGFFHFLTLPISAHASPRSSGLLGSLVIKWGDAAKWGYVIPGCHHSTPVRPDASV